jgi:hypothetical protein
MGLKSGEYGGRKRGAGGFDGLTHGDRFMRGQIIHDDDVCGRERWRQHLLHIGQEGGAVHGAVEDHRCGHALQPERTDEGGRLPMPMRHRRPAAFTAPRATITPGHLGRCPGLVDEDQSLRFQIGLGLEPGPPTTLNVSALLFAGVRGFF